MAVSKQNMLAERSCLATPRCTRRCKMVKWHGLQPVLCQASLKQRLPAPAARPACGHAPPPSRQSPAAKPAWQGGNDRYEFRQLEPSRSRVGALRLALQQLQPVWLCLEDRRLRVIGVCWHVIQSAADGNNRHDHLHGEQTRVCVFGIRLESDFWLPSDSSDVLLHLHHGPC